MTAFQTKDEQTNKTITEALKKYYKDNNIDAVVTVNKDKYGAYDFTIQYNNKIWYCESKERNYKSNQFNTDFLEVDKVNGMRRESKSNNLLYFASFNKDRKILVYNLSDLSKTKVSEVHTNKHTIDCGKGKVDKKMYELNKKDSIFNLEWI